MHLQTCFNYVSCLYLSSLPFQVSLCLFVLEIKMCKSHYMDWITPTLWSPNCWKIQTESFCRPRANLLFKGRNTQHLHYPRSFSFTQVILPWENCKCYHSTYQSWVLQVPLRPFLHQSVSQPLHWSSTWRAKWAGSPSWALTSVWLLHIPKQNSPSLQSLPGLFTH